ncbi:MAG TPA: glycosyltransferase [Gemmatimonadales bacterium]|nr:glycosyltransferase [Gemmatimonadales bacterium]
MIVGILTHAYPRHDGDVAGAFIERLALGLVARGHGVRVVAPADAGRGGTAVRHGVPVIRVRYAPARWETLAYRGTMLAAARSPAGLLWFGSLVWRQARVSRRLWRAEHLDVLHAHWWVPGGTSAWLARRPYVVTLHGMDVVLLEASRGARVLAGRVLRRAAAVTAVSSDLADRAAVALGLERDRIEVQPMPIEAARFTRTSRGGGGIVTVGRLVPRKRLDLLLEALALLRGAGRTLPLTVIGDGPERPRLERRVAELGLGDQVRFRGEVAPADIPDAIGDADVFAFPALGEGFGLAAAEALLLGVPVVASRDGGGVRDIVPERGGGRLVDPDPAAIARAIEELLSDPEARRLAAQAGAALRRRLEPSAVAERFEAIYRRIASRHRSQNAG